jgi:hypothetical protein
MFGGHEAISLRSGVTIRCAIDREVGSAMVVTLGRGADPSSDVSVRLPSPREGIGGLELVVSPDERLAVLLVYSGQSEQGWELFAIEPELRHLSSLPYVQGEGLAPVFSADSRHLAMIVRVEPRERGTGEAAEALLGPDASGEVLIDWATLFIQPVPEGEVEASAIGTWVRRSTDPDEIYGWDLYESVRFTRNHQLTVPLPWGGLLELPVPLGGSVTTPSPPTRSRD